MPRDLQICGNPSVLDTGMIMIGKSLAIMAVWRCRDVSSLDVVALDNQHMEYVGSADHFRPRA